MEAIWFLPAALPVCLWVAWTDMKYMKIPNRAVLTLTALFAVIGLVALPIDVYLVRWLQLGVVLAIGFVMATAGLVGAGDAKFAAAMAPFIAREDALFFAFLFTATLMAALVTHRVARRIPALRRAFADWESWERGNDFPMGLALGGALAMYLALAGLGGISAA